MKVKLFFLFFIPTCVFAQYFETPYPLFPYFDDAPPIVSQAAVLVDAATGALLYSKNASDEIQPASLTKLMTMHLIMKEIKEGRAFYDEIVPITEESWAQNQPPHSSLMFLEPGQIVTLREILLGLAVSSGNDAAVAAALRLAPNMKEFAKLMTEEARNMGLFVTRFEESSGYSELNMITAEEFAFFCYQYITLHPNSIKDFHSVEEFAFPVAANVPNPNKRVSTIVQTNRNTLLYNFEGVDGLKTGFIPASGYNIALTAKRDQTRFILVLLGAPSRPGGSYIRQADGIRLLSWAFKNFKTVRLDIEQLDDVRLWKGKEKFVKLKINNNFENLGINNGELSSNVKQIVFTSHVTRSEKLSFKIVINGMLIAPLPANYPVGYITVSDKLGEVNRAVIITDKAYEKGNILKRFIHSIALLFK